MGRASLGSGPLQMSPLTCSFVPRVCVRGWGGGELGSCAEHLCVPLPAWVGLSSLRHMQKPSLPHVCDPLGTAQPSWQHQKQHRGTAVRAGLPSAPTAGVPAGAWKTHRREGRSFQAVLLSSYPKYLNVSRMASSVLYP